MARAKMARWCAGLCAFAGLLLTAALAVAQDVAPRVAFQTSMGNFVVEMDPQRAPMTVENFLRYVREGHFDGVVFYRVVPGFVIQSGAIDAQGRGRNKRDPIPLETATAASNLRGTIVMARQSDPNSAQSEFFINLRDNTGLDRKPDDPPNQTGYAVFGHVVEGMEVVDAIAMVPLNGNFGPFPDASPMTPVVIQKMAIVN